MTKDDLIEEFEIDPKFRTKDDGIDEQFFNPLTGLDILHDAASEIMNKKNHDYRGGTGDPYKNFRGSDLFSIHPIVGVLLRMQDKMMRIQTFVEKGQLKVKGESVFDALVDLTNYTALIYGMIQEAGHDK